MVNLDLYRVFNSVAKCGSLTKAAKELYISQPAVSLAVKQLENQLGAALFNRTHRGMELTEIGKLIYEDVNSALNLLEDAECKITERTTTASGTVRIGATDSIFSYILADKIAAFSERYPEVKLELISSTSPETMTQLKEGKCDIAFVNLPISDPEVTLCGTIAHISDIFIAGRKYDGLKNSCVQLKDLQEYPLLMIEENTVARREFSNFCDSVGIRLLPDTEVANWDLMKKLVLLGMGVGCIPREYCLSELADGTVFELKTRPALPVRGVGIAVTEGARLSFAMKQFIGLFGDKI